MIEEVTVIEKMPVLAALKRNAWNIARRGEGTGMQRANFQALMRKRTVRIHGSESEDGQSGIATRSSAGLRRQWGDGCHGRPVNPRDSSRTLVYERATPDNRGLRCRATAPHPE